MSVVSMIRKAIARIRNDRRPMCGRCGKTGVRIYRDYGMFRRPETDRCNACISDKSRGWMVPCILDDNGDAWGYGSVPDCDVANFMSLRESSRRHPHWTSRGWSGSWLAEQIIDAIIEGKLVRAECPDHPESGCVMIWSANVCEQLDQAVLNYDPSVERGECPVVHFARAARPFDRIHDIGAGYGRLLFPWRGRWLMVTDRRRLRWTDRRGFHNCTATGVR